MPHAEIEAREMLLEFVPDRGAALQQNGSQLINQRGALAHQSL
jgi:hypothetical protein